MNKKSYWQQEANKWVSAAVLAGGLTAAFLLFFLVRIENRLAGLEERFDVYLVEDKNI